MINIIPDNALVLVTVGLLGVTAYYAWQTRRMVIAMREQTTETISEMRKSQLAAVRPHIRFDLKESGSGVILQIENIGSGPALDVEIIVGLHRGVESVRLPIWSTPVLRPGESHSPDMLSHGRSMFEPVASSPPTVSDLRSAAVAIHMSGSCTSFAGEAISIRQSMDFDPSSPTTDGLVIKS